MYSTRLIESNLTLANGINNQQLTVINNSSTSILSYSSFYSSSPNSYISSFDTDGTNIFVAGNFITYSGNTVNYVAKLDTNGNVLGQLGTSYIGLGARCNCLFYHGSSNRLYVGGIFNTTADMSYYLYGVGYYDFNNNAWYKMGTDPNPGFNFSTEGILAISGQNLNMYNNIFIGGDFLTTRQSVTCNYIAYYTPSANTINPLLTISYGVGANGENGIVYAIAYDVTSNKLYIGGDFKSAGGLQANNIAIYDLTNSTWISLTDTSTNLNGVNDIVRAIYVKNANEIYVGGDFTYVGGQSINNFATWNGSTWSSPAAGNTFNDSVRSIDFDPTTNYIYVGGTFTQPFSRVTFWNTANWNDLSGGVGGDVYSVHWFNSILYVGGSFSSVGSSTPASSIAYWDSSNPGWNSLGTGTLGGGVNGPVYTIEDDGNNIYVGGRFETVDGSTQVNCFAKWNAGWQSISGVYGGNPETSIRTLIHDGSGNIYVGGNFTLVNYQNFSGVTSNNYGIFNANPYPSGSWTVGIGDGVNGIVHSMTHINTTDYTIGLGGNFTSANINAAPNPQVSVNSVSYIKIGVFYPLDAQNNTPGTNNIVRAFTILNDDLYVGGDFTTVNNGTTSGLTVNYIAKWNMTNNVWYNLVSNQESTSSIGLNSRVNCLTNDGTHIYVGGNFTNTDGSTITNGLNHIAKWTPVTGSLGSNGTWSQFSVGISSYGLNANVRSLSYNSNICYVGGDFTSSGSLPLGYVCQINTNTNAISQLGDSTYYGLNSSILAILKLDTKTYLGGGFTQTLPTSSTNPINYSAYYQTPGSPSLNINASSTSFFNTDDSTVYTTVTLPAKFKVINLIYNSSSTYWLATYRSSGVTFS